MSAYTATYELLMLLHRLGAKSEDAVIYLKSDAFDLLLHKLWHEPQTAYLVEHPLPDAYTKQHQLIINSIRIRRRLRR